MTASDTFDLRSRQPMPEPTPTYRCVFCSRHGEYAIHGKNVCGVCLSQLIHIRNEAINERHGVRGCDPDRVWIR